jgi:hypothetical protein
VLKKILLVLLGLVVAFCIFVAMRPNEVAITRTVTVPAPPNIPFGLVNNLRDWQKWAAWEQLDPDMTRQYSGPESGAGATYFWKGDAEVGSGRMTVEQSHPHEHIEMKVEFIEPFEGGSMSDFRFAPAGTDSTEVTWTMRVQMNFLMKAMCLFLDMPGEVGKDMDKGLSQLAVAAKEVSAAQPPPVEEPVPATN